MGTAETTFYLVPIQGVIENGGLDPKRLSSPEK